MTVRKTVLVLALAGAAIPAAFAASGTNWVGGEQGFETHAMQSQASRFGVQRDFQAFRADPTNADGGRMVGGEAGYVGPQHSVALQDGRPVHADTIAPYIPRTSSVMGAAQRRQLQEQSAY